MWFKTSLILGAILWLVLPVEGQQQDGSLFERRVTIEANNQPLSTILDQISWQVKVYFSFDASKINDKKTHHLHASGKSLYTVLKELFDSREYKIYELENQIIIIKKPQEGPDIHSPVPDSIPPKYFFLTGKIIDSKKKYPVSYASISLNNQPIGTISNADGEFLLKLHPDQIDDTLLISSMGYAQKMVPAHQFLDLPTVLLNSISIRIREVKVTALSPHNLLEKIRVNITRNYTSHNKLMTAFYRETVRQDDAYINVSEAVIEILKAPYTESRDDLVRLIKGRQSNDVQPFRWLNLKIQGGPFSITRLDVIKTMETFLDEAYEHLYDYRVNTGVWHNKQPVYILEFTPATGLNFNGYTGELYVHRETFAILHARYGLDRQGLKRATPLLVKHTPRGIKAQPSFVEYRVNYRHHQGAWQLASAQASLKFKIRGKRKNLNSEYHSVCDLLITDIQPTELKKIGPRERFSINDIFVEMIGHYDPKFWENYNIIKPDEELRNALPLLTGQIRKPR